MILRDHEGQVIFAACRWLFDCEGPLEAELAACEEGLRLALHWSQAPLQVETDCAEIITLVKAGRGDRSRNMHQVTEIVHLLNECHTEIHKIINHGQNKAGHVMAAIGRTQLLGLNMLAPQEIIIMITDDCKTVIA